MKIDIDSYIKLQSDPLFWSSWCPLYGKLPDTTEPRINRAIDSISRGRDIWEVSEKGALISEKQIKAAKEIKRAYLESTSLTDYEHTKVGNYGYGQSITAEELFLICLKGRCIFLDKKIKLTDGHYLSIVAIIKAWMIINDMFDPKRGLRNYDERIKVVEELVENAENLNNRFLAKIGRNKKKQQNSIAKQWNETRKRNASKVRRDIIKIAKVLKKRNPFMSLRSIAKDIEKKLSGGDNPRSWHRIYQIVRAK